MNITLEVPESVRKLYKFPYRGKCFESKILPFISTPSSKPIVEYKLLKDLREQGFDLDIGRDNKSMYNPNDMFRVLEKYTVRSTFAESKFVSDAYNVARSTFGGHKDVNLLPDELVESSIKGNKSSGAPSFTTKREAFELDFDRYINIKLRLRAPDPCVAFHRVQHGENGPKNRLVWGFPQSMTMLESKFARPLIQRFLKRRTPMCIGLKKSGISARSLRIENSGLRYGIDFSSFDATVHPKLITMAFSILKTHFNFNDEMESMWDKIIHYFIHTPIIMPDGGIYVKHQGIPSGSYFTQLIGSIVNYIIIQTIMLELSNGTKIASNKILVLGDDSLFGFNEYYSLDTISRIASKYGFSVNVLKSEISKEGHSFSFLGHRWNHGSIDRDPIDIAKRIAFPEKHNRSNLDPRDRIRQRMLAYLSDAKCAAAIYSKWSRYKGPDVAALYGGSRSADPVTGWEEFKESEGQYDPFIHSFVRNYIGIRS